MVFGVGDYGICLFALQECFFCNSGSLFSLFLFYRRFYLVISGVLIGSLFSLFLFYLYSRQKKFFV